MSNKRNPYEPYINFLTKYYPGAVRDIDVGARYYHTWTPMIYGGNFTTIFTWLRYMHALKIKYALDIEVT